MTDTRETSYNEVASASWTSGGAVSPIAAVTRVKQYPILPPHNPNGATSTQEAQVSWISTTFDKLLPSFHNRITPGSMPDKFAQFFKTIKFKKIDNATLDEISRVVAAFRGSIKQEQYRRNRTKLDGWDAHAPTARPVHDYPGEYTLDQRSYTDHTYLEIRHDGRRVYISEPYKLYADDLKQLLELHEKGWDIAITGDSLHYPGATLRIALTHPDTPYRGKREGIPTKQRFQILKRDNYRCQLCGATAANGSTLHIDHKHPVSKGGQTTEENLWTLCQPCNQGKSSELL